MNRVVIQPSSRSRSFSWEKGLSMCFCIWVRKSIEVCTSTTYETHEYAHTSQDVQGGNENPRANKVLYLSKPPPRTSSGLGITIHYIRTQKDNKTQKRLKASLKTSVFTFCKTFTSLLKIHLYVSFRLHILYITFMWRMYVDSLYLIVLKRVHIYVSRSILPYVVSDWLPRSLPTTPILRLYHSDCHWTAELQR